MSNPKFAPIVPIAKRGRGFSIESLMRKDDERPHTSSGEDSDSADEIHTRAIPTQDEQHSTGCRIPPLHPALPVHVQHLLLQDQARRNSQHIVSQQTQGECPCLPASIRGPDANTHPVLAGYTAQFGAAVRLGLPGGAQNLANYPSLLAAATGRDPFAVYPPWILGKQGPGALRFPYGPSEAGGLFFNPYRKPKRVRTAFSPSQLLKLEHAFEKNHYVVGQERKELAAKLNLTETQVKVWFQNRRTKHKRVKSDDEGDSCDISVDDAVDVGPSSNTRIELSHSHYEQH